MNLRLHDILWYLDELLYKIQYKITVVSKPFARSSTVIVSTSWLGIIVGWTVLIVVPSAFAIWMLARLALSGETNLSLDTPELLFLVGIMAAICFNLWLLRTCDYFAARFLITNIGIVEIRPCGKINRYRWKSFTSANPARHKIHFGPHRTLFLAKISYYHRAIAEVFESAESLHLDNVPPEVLNMLTFRSRSRS